MGDLGFDHPNQIEVGDIDHHDQLALDVFAADRIGSAGAPDMSYRIQRQFGACRALEN